MDPFSIAAGVIAFASLAKDLSEVRRDLVKFIKNARSAPAKLERLARELEASACILTQLGDLQSRICHSRLLLLETENLRTATESLRTIVTGLQRRHIKWRTGARLVAAYRDSDIENLLKDLDRTKLALIFAHSLYLGEALSARFDMLALSQAQEAATHSQTLSIVRHVLQFPGLNDMNDLPREGLSAVDDANRGVAVSNSSQAKLSAKSSKRRQTESRTIFSLTFPFLLSHGAWQLAMNSAQGKWNIMLRAIRYVTYDSPIVRSMSDGDIRRVASLIETGEAHPADSVVKRDGGKVSLLYTAMHGPDPVAMCTYLLDTFGPDFDADAMVEALNFCQLISGSSPGYELYTALLRLFIEGADMDVLLDWDVNHMIKAPRSLRTMWLTKCRSLPILDTVYNRWLQTPNLRPQVADLVRTDPIVLVNHCRHGPHALLIFFGIRLDSTEFYSLTQEAKDWMLHLMAAYICSGDTLYRSFWSLSERQQCFRNLIIAGADLHAIIHDRTPLQTALIPCLQYTDCTLPRFLQSWLLEIQSVKINLEDYGSQESKQWRQSECVRMWIQLYAENSGDYMLGLNGLSFGRHVKDWALHGLVKHPVPVFENRTAPPGSWPENNTVPSRICWTPMWEDGDGWRRVTTTTTIPIAMYSGENLPTLVKDFDSVIKGSGDDHSLFALESLRRVSSPRRRSHSQPRSVYRTASDRAESASFLRVHRCPFDVRNRYHRTPEWDTQNRDRRCVQGAHQSLSDYLDSSVWRAHWRSMFDLEVLGI